jgi:hypothetical protein
VRARGWIAAGSVHHLLWVALFTAGLTGEPHTALALPCGDGIIEAGTGEVCDHGAANGTPGDCCDLTCRPVFPGTACEDNDGNPCTGQCDGQQGICIPAPISGPVCRPAVSECDVAETCTDSTGGITCPQDSFQPAGTTCSQGVCDGRGGCCGDGVVQGSEQCDEGQGSNGASDSCCDASCHLRRPNTFCRQGANVCQQDATCNGTSGVCPDNPPVSSDTSCDDGDPCTQADHCDAGSCVRGSTLCSTTTSLVRAANGNPAAIAVDCFGQRTRRKASCLAFARARPPTSAPTNDSATPSTAFALASGGGCHPADDGTILVSRQKRRALPKSGTVLVRLKLNACVRKLYQELHPGETLPVEVTVRLAGVQSGDDSGSDSVTLKKIVGIARGQ